MRCERLWSRDREKILHLGRKLLREHWDERVNEGVVSEAHFSQADGSAVVLTNSATRRRRSRRLYRRFRNDSEAVGLGKVCVETSVHRGMLQSTLHQCLAQDAIGP